MKAYASKLFIFSHASSKLQPCRDNKAALVNRAGNSSPEGGTAEAGDEAGH